MSARAFLTINAFLNTAYVIVADQPVLMHLALAYADLTLIYADHALQYIDLALQCVDLILNCADHAIQLLQDTVHQHCVQTKNES